MPLVTLGQFGPEFSPQFDFGHVTNPGYPVTVDLRFLADSRMFSADFDNEYRRVGQTDPMFTAGSFDGDFDPDFEGAAQTPYGTVKSPRPDQPLWRRFAYQPAPQGLLLFRDPASIKLVSSFHDPEFADADEAVLGGQHYVFPYGGWQCDLLESAGFQIVPAQNLNAPPYIVDEQGETL